MFAPFRRLAAALVLITTTFGLSAAYAGGVEMPNIDVEKIKTSCQDGTDPTLDYAVTTNRMQANMEYRECLKKVVLFYWKQMSPDQKSEARFAKQLDDFTNPFIRSINDIFLGNKACPCGTLYNDYYSIFTAKVYEMLLEAMAEAAHSN